MPNDILEVTLTVPYMSIKSGQTVPVAVKVRNISSDPVWIVGNLDGSETGYRFPKYLPVIRGPELSLSKENLPWCGMVAPLRIDDFCLLQPGKDFNPCDPSISESYLPFITFSSFSPAAPGRYEISITLTTESRKDDDWLGIIEYPGKEMVLERLKLVPRVTVESNAAIVLVV